MKVLQIVHFESDPAYLNAVNEQISGLDGTVVATAQDSLSCFKLAGAMSEGSVGCDAVILGDIPDLAGGQPGNHMRGLMKYMESRELRPRTIGLASLAMEEFGVQVDVDLTKRNTHRISEVVRKLRTIAEAQESLGAINASCKNPVTFTKSGRPSQLTLVHGDANTLQV